MAPRDAKGVRLYTRNGHAPLFPVMPVTDRAEQVSMDRVLGRALARQPLSAS
jgi:hypothetical protein